MQFEDVNIQDLISEFKAFSVEGFNIFGLGEDNLPHIVCVCPNKQFARAIQSMSPSRAGEPRSSASGSRSSKRRALQSSK